MAFKGTRLKEMPNLSSIFSKHSYLLSFLGKGSGGDEEVLS